MNPSLLSAARAGEWCQAGNLALFIARFILLPNNLFAVLEGINALSSGFPRAARVCLLNSCAKCRGMWAVRAALIFPSHLHSSVLNIVHCHIIESA